MVKKTILIAVVGVLCGLSYFCVFHLEKPSKNTNAISEASDESELFHAKVAFNAESLKEVIDEAPVIIEATIGKEINEVEFASNSYFVITEAKINDVIKGEGLNENDTINIIQTKNLIEDPTVEDGSKKILFLIKYDCKEYANNEFTYACIGGYQGIYNINDDGTISNSLKFENVDETITGKDTGNIEENALGANADNVDENFTDAYPDSMYKDFAGGKTKDEFINEITELK